MPEVFSIVKKSIILLNSAIQCREDDSMAVRGETSEKIRSQVREPKRYQVIMHNDDYTPMDFVVDILMGIFHKEEAEANVLMMKVHQEGEAAVGSYSYDVAYSKLRLATELAEEEGYPFRLSLREV